ncbi:MAG: PadR family transcriptional regulator [Actinomycetota bacterium]
MPGLTTTSYAFLGLLAIRPWSSYELTRQMSRSLGLMWPRAESKLYEEPKKLVAYGLAEAGTELVGRRSRTVYAITAEGRRALAEWLTEPGAGPALEFEGLVKAFFSENGTKADLLATVEAAREWARGLGAQSHAIGTAYGHGEGPFPERRAQQLLVARFLNDFYVTVAQWAQWAATVVDAWPDDPGQAVADPAEIDETNRRAALAAGLDGH